MIASLKLLTQTMDGCLILNKLVRRVKLCQRVMENTAMLTVEMWALLSGFSCPTQTLLILAPILLGSGEATHSALLRMKRVNSFKGLRQCWLGGASTPTHTSATGSYGVSNLAHNGLYLILSFSRAAVLNITSIDDSDAGSCLRWDVLAQPSSQRLVHFLSLVRGGGFPCADGPHWLVSYHHTPPVGYIFWGRQRA